MKVLIIDDEPLVRRSLEKIFSRNNFEIFSAENGVEGIKRWKECSPDLVYLDVLMPGLNGFEVLKEIPPPRLAKVVLMSAFTGKQPNLFEVQHDLFIQKPFKDIFEVYNQGVALLEARK